MGAVGFADRRTLSAQRASIRRRRTARGCTQDCRSESCGDGVIQPELGETCDEGDKNLSLYEYFGYGCNEHCLDYWWFLQ